MRRVPLLGAEVGRARNEGTAVSVALAAPPRLVSSARPGAGSPATSCHAVAGFSFGRGEKRNSSFTEPCQNSPPARSRPSPSPSSPNVPSGNRWAEPPIFRRYLQQLCGRLGPAYRYSQLNLRSGGWAGPPIFRRYLQQTLALARSSKTAWVVARRGRGLLGRANPNIRRLSSPPASHHRHLQCGSYFNPFS
jgi:hypothetical protein